MREENITRHRDVQHSAKRTRHTAHYNSKSNQSVKYNGIFNSLFRQIIFSSIILAILFGIKGIDNPSAKELNSRIASSIKYNIEYDWIISNINKSTQYIISMLAKK